MKKLLFTLLSITLFIASSGQVAINGDGTNPHASAMLDVSSISKGMLVPRMTTTQRTTIAAPAKGLLVFDITTNTFWFHNETAWVEIKSSSLPSANNTGDMLYWNGSQWTIVPRGLTNQVLTMNALGVPEWKSAPPAVYSIAVTPANSTVVLGETKQFTATATYTDASTADVSSQVTWTSSNTSVATVNSSGNATTLSGGSTNITATLGVYSSTANLTVNAPTLSISNTFVTEGNSGTTPMTFTVSLSLPAQSTVTVDYSSEHFNTNSADYTPVTGTLTFAPGETSKNITVLVTGDAIFEFNQYFYLNLANPHNASISDHQGTGTIYNDDAVPALSISNASITEGNSGTQNMSFTVTVTGQSEDIIDPYYHVVGQTATANSDFQATDFILFINPGETTKTINIVINGDVMNESNETFRLEFFNLNRNVSDQMGGSFSYQICTITSPNIIGTIINDDPQPVVSIDNVTKVEGNYGTTTYNFPVTLSSPSGYPVSVNFSTSNGTALVADGDYQAGSGTVTIFPGQTSINISVNVKGDEKDEFNETFTVTISNPVNAVLGTATASGTITNDDLSPVASILNESTTEGNFGNQTLTFTLTLSAISGKPVTIDFTTQNGTATAADNDYTPVNGSLTFASGETEKDINVIIIGDTKHEGSETFSVALSNASNATISGGPAQGMIINDDQAPQISISPASITEGNSGVSTMVFTVTLSGSTSQNVSVNYSTSNNSATLSDGDYSSSGGTIFFVEGETSKTISVPVNGDLKYEVNGTFFVVLSTPVNASIQTGTATGTIINDDAPPTISIGNVSQVEGDAGTTAFVFTVTLSAPSGQVVAVNFATSELTAISTGPSADYVAISGTVSFAPGETSKTITVMVNGDISLEQDEVFRVILSVPVNATIMQSTGTATITNDDN